MRAELILPAAVAISVHAFLLLGMNGKSPKGDPTPPEFRPPTPPGTVEVDPEDFPRLVPDSGDDPTRKDWGGAVRGLDTTTYHPGQLYFETPRLPPISGGPQMGVVPMTWQNPAAIPDDPSIHVFRADELDRVPRARLQPAPAYPADQRMRGIEATVTVEFIVDETGSVHNVAVVRATTTGFDEATLRAVSRWKFEPGMYRNRRVRFRMSVPVVFTLKADD